LFLKPDIGVSGGGELGKAGKPFHDQLEPFCPGKGKGNGRDWRRARKKENAPQKKKTPSVALGQKKISWCTRNGGKDRDKKADRDFLTGERGL